MKTVTKYALVLVGLVWASAFGQGLTFGRAFEVKDRNGVSVLTVDNVKMFLHSEYFKEDVPVFQGVVKVSGETLMRVALAGIVHKKDGSVVKFNAVNSFCPTSRCDLLKNSTQKAAYLFTQPWPFKPEDFDSVEFVLEKAERMTIRNGFHVSGFIAKDEGCFNDYLGTKSLTGVILRKKLVELVEYGCGFAVDDPLVASLVESTRKTFDIGGKIVAGIQVVLFDERATLGLERRSSHVLESGWVLVSALLPGPVLTSVEIGVLKE